MVIPEYEEAGVKIIQSYLSANNVTDTVIANVAGPAVSEDAGRILGNRFIVDSGGTGHALLQRVDDFPTLRIFGDAFAETVTSGCPDCEITDLNNTIAEASGGNVVPPVVSALRTNADINYLISSHAPFVAGLSAALSAAGIEEQVRVAGENADAQALTSLREGDIAALTGNPLHYAAWGIVDVALRHAQGMEFSEEGPPMPMQRLTDDVEFEIANSHDVPMDFEEQFLALWGVER